MFKFEVGSVYYARSACNHDCVFLMKVLSRTEKSVKAEFSGEGVKRAMIRVSDSGEWVMPWHYSMAPEFRAERLYSDGVCPRLFCCPGRSKRDKLSLESLDCLPVEFTAFMW